MTRDRASRALSNPFRGVDFLYSTVSYYFLGYNRNNLLYSNNSSTIVSFLILLYNYSTILIILTLRFLFLYYFVLTSWHQLYSKSREMLR